MTIDEVDRIEVLKGPASAVFGANAISGVINIIPKTPQQLQGGRLRYTAGERSFQQGSFVYGRQKDRLGYRLGGGWNSANQFQEAGRFASEAGKFNSLFRYRFSEDSEISASGGVTRLNTQFAAGAGGPLFDKGIGSYARLDYRYAGARLRAFWNHGRTSFEDLAVLPNFNLDYDTYDVEIEQSLALPLRQQAVFGASYRRNTARSLILTPGLMAQDLWSAFFEDKWSLTEQWSLMMSGRVDRHPFTPILFSPRASLLYRPVPKQTFRVSAATAFRNPTLTDNYLDVTTRLPNDGVAAPNPPFAAIESRAVGNRNLDPERIESIEAAYEGDVGRIKTTLAAFHYRLKSVIKDILRGGEAGFEALAAPWLTTFANYSYQDLHDHSTSRLMSRQSPRHKANAGLRAKSHGFTGSLWGNWVDRTVWPSSLTGGNPLPVNAYFLVHLHAGYAFSGRWSGLEAGVTAFNLLNHDHFEILPAQSSAAMGQGGEIIRSRWTGTVSYKF